VAAKLRKGRPSSEGATTAAGYKPLSISSIASIAAKKDYRSPYEKDKSIFCFYE